MTNSILDSADFSALQDQIDSLQRENLRLRVSHATMSDNLSSVQKRCTELLEELRAMKTRTFDAYQAASARTLNPSLPISEALANYALGLGGEAGEVQELVKKHVFHGKELSRDAVLKELGDCAWYLAAVASTVGIRLSEVAAANVEKLLARYPNGFVTGGGNR